MAVQNSRGKFIRKRFDLTFLERLLLIYELGICSSEIDATVDYVNRKLDEKIISGKLSERKEWKICVTDFPQINDLRKTMKRDKIEDELRFTESESDSDLWDYSADEMFPSRDALMKQTNEMFPSREALMAQADELLPSREALIEQAKEMFPSRDALIRQFNESNENHFVDDFDDE